MKKKLLILLLVISFCLFTPANAASQSPEVLASLKVQDSCAFVCAKIIAPGQEIQAKVELLREGKRQMTWTFTGRSTLSISENLGALSVQNSTLKVTGCVNGVKFTPVILTHAC